MPALARPTARRLARPRRRLERCRRPEAGRWTRLERDIQVDISALFPGETLVRVTGVHVSADSANGNTIYFDDLRFSNSLTVEHNVLEPGRYVGHIVRNHASVTGLDTFFHYDQVGSVIARSDASGDLDSQRHADAFGNDLQDWATGLWATSNSWSAFSGLTDSATQMLSRGGTWYRPSLALTLMATGGRPGLGGKVGGGCGAAAARSGGWSFDHGGIDVSIVGPVPTGIPDFFGRIKDRIKDEFCAIFPCGTIYPISPADRTDCYNLANGASTTGDATNFCNQYAACHTGKTPQNDNNMILTISEGCKSYFSSGLPGIVPPSELPDTGQWPMWPLGPGGHDGFPYYGSIH